MATALNEIALNANVAIAVNEQAVPVRPAVVGACEILGIDPLTIANEGRLVVIVAPEARRAALAALQSHALGREATLIGGLVRPIRHGLLAHRHRRDTRIGYARSAIRSRGFARRAPIQKSF